MTSQKRAAMIFLSVINIINIIAGIITQATMALGRDVTSVIPIKAEMTVNEILLLNFTVVFVIMTLISVVTTYLATDVTYSPVEILSNCPPVLLIIPLVLVFVSLYNAVCAEIAADRIWILFSSAVYVLANAVNFGCVSTIKEDSEN